MKTFTNTVLVSLLISVCFAAQAAAITVIDPWVRIAPPKAPALAAFMKLENHTNIELAVVGARTSLKVDRVELHRTRMVDGVMKMMQQESIPVAAHSSTLLEPGSWHIMLVKPAEVPKPGDSVDLVLLLNDGSEHKVTATVRKGMKMMEGKHEHKMETN